MLNVMKPARYTIVIALLVLLFFPATVALSSTLELKHLWLTTVDFESDGAHRNDYATAVFADGDGIYIVGGTAKGPTFLKDTFLAECDTSGVLQSENILTGIDWFLGGGNDEATDVVKDGKYLYIIGFYSVTSVQSNAYLLQLDTSTSIYDMIGEPGAYLCAVAVHEGSVYFCYQTLDLAETVLTKYDSTLDVIWSKDLELDFAVEDMASSATGLYLAGTKRLTITEPIACLEKRSTTGDLNWHREWVPPTTYYPGPDVSIHALGKRITCHNGYIYLGGQACVNEEPSGVLLKWDPFLSQYDENGNLIWNQIWQEYPVTTFEGLAGDGDFLYVVGWYYPAGSMDQDSNLAAYDANGNYVSTQTWDDEYAFGVAVARGVVYVCGRTRTPPDPDGKANAYLTAYTFGIPDADAGDPVTGVVNAPLSFDGTASLDPDGTIVAYSWDFDAADGISQDATGATPIHTYTEARTYLVTLTVTDNDGLTDIDTCLVTVITPLQALDDLVNIITDLSLPKGHENSLLSKLEDVKNHLLRGQEHAAIKKLQDFINAVEARRGKVLTEQQAETLIQHAQELIASLQSVP